MGSPASPLTADAPQASGYGRLRHWTLFFALIITLYSALVPVGRMGMLFELSYNEGWNVFNAQRVVEHQQLYPAAASWTANNYPALSFWILGALHSITHEYLFTARAVSLLSLLLVASMLGWIAVRLGASRFAALLTTLFCLGLFCTACESYVGMDDPQMLAHALMLSGLCVYLRNRTDRFNLLLAALLFVAGGCVKHSLVDLPLAVGLDLLLRNRAKAAWFALSGIGIAILAVWANIHFGGPYFLKLLLAPRQYSSTQFFRSLQDTYGQMLVPTLIGMLMAVRFRHDAKRRFLSLWFLVAAALGAYFGGGVGVTINANFDSLLAMTLLLGFFLDEQLQLSESGNAKWWNRWTAPALFAWLVIPLLLSDNANPVSRLQEDTASAKRFHQEVEVLRAQPGPVLCESLLRCYYANKPFLYDGFNATRQVEFGSLHESDVLDPIRAGKYGAIELNKPLENTYRYRRFTPRMLRAIGQSYVVALEDDDARICVPESATDSLPQKACTIPQPRD